MPQCSRNAQFLNKGDQNAQFPNQAGQSTQFPNQGGRNVGTEFPGQGGHNTNPGVHREDTRNINPAFQPHFPPSNTGGSQMYSGHHVADMPPANIYPGNGGMQNTGSRGMYVYSLYSQKLSAE